MIKKINFGYKYIFIKEGKYKLKIKNKGFI